MDEHYLQGFMRILEKGFHDVAQVLRDKLDFDKKCWAMHQQSMQDAHQREKESTKDLVKMVEEATYHVQQKLQHQHIENCEECQAKIRELAKQAVSH